MKVATGNCIAKSNLAGSKSVSTFPFYPYGKKRKENSLIIGMVYRQETGHRSEFASGFP